MAGRYAENTEVSSEKSRAEIERTLRRFGASGFAYAWTNTTSRVEFTIDNLHVRFELTMPDPNDREFTHTPEMGYRRSDTAREKAYEQAVRQRWRALALVIKAKLEAVSAGITTVEDEFMARIVMLDGKTISEHVAPEIAYIKSGARLAITEGEE